MIVVLRFLEYLPMALDINPGISNSSLSSESFSHPLAQFMPEIEGNNGLTSLTVNGG